MPAAAAVVVAPSLAADPLLEVDRRSAVVGAPLLGGLPAETGFDEDDDDDDARIGVGVDGQSAAPWARAGVARDVCVGCCCWVEEEEEARGLRLIGGLLEVDDVTSGE